MEKRKRSWKEREGERKRKGEREVGEWGIGRKREEEKVGERER